MKGFHVTFMKHLDSILSEGLFPKNTTENNFLFAFDNRAERLFFMPDFSAAKWWFEHHHPHDWIYENGEFLSEIPERESVIIEFYLPTAFRVFTDPYAWSMDSSMKLSRYIEEKIKPNFILDIHDPVLV